VRRKNQLLANERLSCTQTLRVGIRPKPIVKLSATSRQKEERDMLRKIALGIAFIAILSTSLSAFAAGGNRAIRGHSIGRGSAHMYTRRSVARTTRASVRRSIQVGRSVQVTRRLAHPHRRHFWKGRWWEYGIGECWHYVPKLGEYIWVCGY
jgi:hypothetical protein